MQLTLIQQLSIVFIPMVLAITLHEAAHAKVAHYFGDDTAYKFGRLSLDPIKHIDLVGTIVCPLICLIAGSPIFFGWAKPIPINYRKLANPRLHSALIALAGPLANLAMALAWAFIAKSLIICNCHVQISSNFDVPYKFLLAMASQGIKINAILTVFNLLPIPPLDGSKLLILISDKIALRVIQLEPYGFFILASLMACGVLSRLVIPGAYLIINILFGFAKF